MKHKIIRFYKISLSVLIIIPVIAFLGFVAAVNFIDFNQYKPQIEKEISALSERNFDIKGAIDISVIPFALKIGQAELQNPKDFGDFPAQVAFKNLYIEISALTLLLDKKIEIQSLNIEKPILNLIRTKEGRDNWSDFPRLLSWLQEDSYAPTLGQTQTPNYIFENLNPIPNAQANSNDTIYPWFLNSLIIEKGQINIIDQQQDFSAQISELNLLANDVNPIDAFQTKSVFLYHHSLSPRYFQANLNSEAQRQGSFFKWHFKDISGLVMVDLDNTNQFPGVRFGVKASQAKLNLTEHKMQVNHLALNGLNGQALIDIEGRYGKNPEFNGQLNAESIDFQKWTKYLGLDLPQLKNKYTAEQIKATQSGEFNWNWTGRGIYFTPIKTVQ